MGQIIALANQKGGVGKTTTTISLGAALAELGKRVLLVDLDPQGAASIGVGVNGPELDVTIHNLLLDRSASFDDVVVKTNIDGLELLPANIDLSVAEVALVGEVAREQTLKRVLQPARAVYDFILIDCPPSLGLLTINALTAADSVIIPLECEFFALRGMSLLVDTIDKVRDRLNFDLRIQGVVPTMYDGRMVHSREVLDRVRSSGAHVFDATIPRTVRFAEAPVVGEPILTYASDSKGAWAYRRLAKEVLGIVDDTESITTGGGRAVPNHDAAAGGPGTVDERHAGAGDAGAGEPIARPAADGGPTAAAPVGPGSPGTGAAGVGAETGERPPAPRGEGDVLLHP